MKARSFLVVFVVTTLVVGCWGYWIRHRLDVLHKVFSRVEPPITESSLRHDLGIPWRSEACGRVFGGDMPQGCMTEIIYASPLAPLVPEYWAFRFGKDGMILNRYEYQSAIGNPDASSK
jgi:hypothetical protein